METADDAHEMLCDVTETDLNIPELCTLGTGVRLSLTHNIWGGMGQRLDTNNHCSLIYFSLLMIFQSSRMNQRIVEWTQ